MKKITHAEIRMYRLGTGDCFAVKFFSGENVHLKFLIDAGCWSGSRQKLTPYIENLLEYLDNYVDVLVVTHEHKDHVHAFDVCNSLFTDGNKFEAGQIWMAWTENDGVKEVEEWKSEYGAKKKILGLAAKKLDEVCSSTSFHSQLKDVYGSDKMLSARKGYSKTLQGFAELHLAFDNEAQQYVGGLAGMNVVKKEVKTNSIRYLKPGDIISEIADKTGIRIYVLGPPELFSYVKKESGGVKDSYEHNKILKESGAFDAAILNFCSAEFNSDAFLPFDEQFSQGLQSSSRSSYEKEEEAWRKIDYEWLFSSGSLALRMDNLTNNLSLALALEIGDRGKVLLFPGDAEFGSWSSWHKIDWKLPDDVNEPKKHFTEDLLNRTVFYKVAHHLSHNGTAKKLGLEMMTHKELAAMATLDYAIISDGWKSTMPNREIVRELLKKTKGRLIIMNEDDLFYDFHEKVRLSSVIGTTRRDEMTSTERSLFESNFKRDNLFLEYRIIF